MKGAHSHYHDSMDDSDQETKSDPYRPPVGNTAAYNALMGELTDFLHANEASGHSKPVKLDISDSSWMAIFRKRKANYFVKSEEIGLCFANPITLTQFILKFCEWLLQLQPSIIILAELKRLERVHSSTSAIVDLVRTFFHRAISLSF